MNITGSYIAAGYVLSLLKFNLHAPAGKFREKGLILTVFQGIMELEDLMAKVIAVQPWSISSGEISSIINESFPEVICTTKGEYFCALSQSSRTGATVQIRYDTVTVKGGFPGFLGQALFALFVVALGIIPPLIIYYFTFYRKFRSFEAKIAESITGACAQKGILRDGETGNQ